MAVRLRSKGFTLLEILVASSLGALLLGLIVATLMMARQATQKSEANYGVAQDLPTAIHRIRDDLQETALASIRTQPDKGWTSMISARESSKAGGGQLVFSPYGVPQWKKHVAYAVEPGAGPTSRLVRWEKEFTGLWPAAADFEAYPVGDASTQRTILEGVFTPTGTVAGIDRGAAPGFSVNFLTRKNGETGTEALSPINPTARSQGGDWTDNTPLVEVHVSSVQIGASGKPSYFEMSLRVRPNY